MGLHGGYMPSFNETATNLRGARRMAADLAAGYRDDGEPVTGSAAAGYYDLGQHEYIEITDCAEIDCLDAPA